MPDSNIKLTIKDIAYSPDTVSSPFTPNVYQKLGGKRGYQEEIPYPSPTEKRLRISTDGNFEQFQSYVPLSPPSPYVFYNQYPNPVEPVPSERMVLKPKATRSDSQKTKTSSTAPTHVTSDDGKHIWELIKSLGKGGCGEVFLGREITTCEFTPVAIKIIRERKQFNIEYATMKLLNTHTNGRGDTPKLLHACKKQKTLIMEHLSEPVSAKFERQGYRFSLKTILMLSLNIMTLIKDFSLKTGQVHVDIKPSNLCTSADGRTIYLIDFGYSTSPLVKLPGQTVPSIQDDLESLAYVLMFFVAGGKKGLPWGALRTHKEIAKAKNDTAICQFINNMAGTDYEPIMTALANFLFVTRDRTKPFTWKSFYALYHEFENVLHYCGYNNDGMYDWCEQESTKLTSLSSSSKTLIPPFYTLE